MASVQWTKHLKTEGAKEDFRVLLGNSTALITRLRELMLEEINNIDNSEYLVSDFEDPSWSHKQAFRNGQKAALKKVVDLLTINRK